MHIFFSGIGGAGMGPLALIAHRAGYIVSGSDKRDSSYVEHLKQSGIVNIHIGQSHEQISAVHVKQPIDWMVYSSAISIENPNHPELVFAHKSQIKTSKRDQLLNKIIVDSDKKLIAIAGTHGKTTTTAMVIWLLKELKIDVSYSLGAKISFGDMGQFDQKGDYFIYECDEYDRNFLSFSPFLSVISGIGYDHQDIYPTKEDYNQAFREFLNQSQNNILWQEDATTLNVLSNNQARILDSHDKQIENIHLAGQVNRLNGWLAIQAVRQLTKRPVAKLIELINQFPGVSRRFEKIAINLYSDYAHTPEKITGCLELAQEISKRLVIVYEPLTNKRQYAIRKTYEHMFDAISKIYWVPSYLTREDPKQPVLKPEDLILDMSNPSIAEPVQLDENLKQLIIKHQKNGDLVVCLSGGGGGSLDEWLRSEFSK